MQSAGRANFENYVFDLDVLDAGGNPTVARWVFKDDKIDNHQQCWDWLGTTGIELVFRR